MTSPWKFLIGLTRRPGRGDATPASNDEAATNSRDAVPSSVEIDGVDASPDLDFLRGAEDGGTEQVDDLETLVAITAAAAEEKPQTPSQPTRKRAPRKHVNRSGTRQSNAIEPTPAQRAEPRDSARELDNEIRQLRLQLAQKLELQNAQLRKMLDRFNR